MLAFFRRIYKKTMTKNNFIINNKSVLIIALLASSYMFSQPPPPCNANGNSGFGGAVGEGQFLFTGEFSNPIIFEMNTGGNDINDILVLYIDTGASGRNIIDFTVDDNADDHRVAISNSNAFGNGSIIQFPPGFEATHAVAINTNFGGLWSIPNTGNVGAGELQFVTAINSNLTSNTQGFYNFSFNWEDLGLPVASQFDFVGVYVSSTAYNSDEGYGAGITQGTLGADPIVFNGYLTLPGCAATLSTTEETFKTITGYYANDKLFIKGVNDKASINVYDIQGRNRYSENHQIQDDNPIALELVKNELLFIVIESSGKKKVLKVLPN